MATGIVLQLMVVLDQLVELLPFFFSDCCDGSDDVYILSSSLYVHPLPDVVFVQIKKHRRIIALE